MKSWKIWKSYKNWKSWIEVVPDYDWIYDVMELTGFDYPTVAFAYYLLNR